MNRFIKLPKICFSFAILLVFLPGAASSSPTTDVIEKFHSQLLSVMKEAKILGLQGRYTRLEPAISEAFNLALMVRIATGGYWKKADTEQKKRLVSSFKKISVSTYAKQFSGYSGQSFSTVGEKSGPQRTRLVDTRIRRPEKSPVKITYVMKNDRIVDVLLDNSISELAVRRSEYRQILKSSGVDGLINILDDKAKRLIGN